MLFRSQAAGQHGRFLLQQRFLLLRVGVRARDEHQARILIRAGASIVVPETLEASLQLSAFVLEAMGLDPRKVDEIVDAERDVFAATLAQAADAHLPAQLAAPATARPL